MKKLTKVEEQVMQIIWQLGRCTVREVIEQLGDKKTPHSTISSVVRILEKKGFVNHKAYGRTHEYFAIISQEEYSHQRIKGLVDNYFSGSFNELVSFFVKKNELKPDEIKSLLDRLDESEE